jgi:multiple sugar transport system permease protein
MAPYLVLFITFILGPAVFGIWISLHEWDYLLPGKPFVGLDNYGELFASGSRTGASFWRGMTATGIFTALSVPLLVIIPLGIAVLLNKRFRGQKVFRAIYFAPYALGVAVIGILFRFILDPNVGLLNYYLGEAGLPDDVPWTTDSPWVWVTLVGVTVWWTLGFNTIIYLAGLQDIPSDHYDSARVDGANGWQLFRHITLPGLRQVLVFVLTITILASANVFGQAYLITRGGPANQTKTAIWHIADEGLRSFNMGDAASMSYMLAAFLIVIAVLNFKFFGQRND